MPTGWRSRWLLAAAVVLAVAVAVVVVAVVVVAVVARGGGGRDWDRVMARFGTSVAEACAEYRDGVDLYGGEAQYQAVLREMMVVPAGDEGLREDWIAYADKNC